jgi:hypothetical protein
MQTIAVRFHFEWVNTQNMEILEYPISNTECPISIFWNSITTAKAVQGVSRRSRVYHDFYVKGHLSASGEMPFTQKSAHPQEVCVRAVTLSPLSGECFRIRNKPINMNKLQIFFSRLHSKIHFLLSKFHLLISAL